MKRVEIPPKKTASIPLQGEDPFDVTFALKSEGTEPGFQMKVGAANGVPLKQLAVAGQDVTIQISLAAKQRNGRQLSQVMSTSLTTRDGDNFDVIAAPGDESEFVAEVMNRMWDTEFVAGNGQTAAASVDFDNLLFRTRDFTGNFSDLAVYDGEMSCRIYGRWSAQGSKGDVSFTVKKATPDKLEGEYTFDGNKQKFRWTERR
jgi:hypothetical protein